ncbi:hypothetical protein EDI_157940 [Entamoeba dispar SAW760]|uniref:Tetraspanin family protein n=1 Tax=Entamoeba dispar (strain ATCC PRA-260 / SAW760) TaxID=370354 RepID=B0ELL1_ENTDS|nr:uncharacterized protein EDI_157940 [Entamoeba dispar SAW760]EDR24586.1 hypothetical protein EDI_157940 [Entamoeba dispar SAW760]|eukprot:EDR24586.1 hypothetical protein EDI_157940 [Entamoeba dispar SAW760]
MEKSRIFGICFGIFLIISGISVEIVSGFGGFNKITDSKKSMIKYSKTFFRGFNYAIGASLFICGILLIITSSLMNGFLINGGGIINLMLLIFIIGSISYFSYDLRQLFTMDEEKARIFQIPYDCCGWKLINTSSLTNSTCLSPIGIKTEKTCFQVLKDIEYADYQEIVVMMYSIVLILISESSYRLLNETLQQQNTNQEVSILPRMTEEINDSNEEFINDLNDNLNSPLLTNSQDGITQRTSESTTTNSEDYLV